MDKEENFYNLICKKRFDNIDDSIKLLTDLLRGANNTVGLLEEVRSLKRINKIVIAVATFFVGTFCVQFISWLFGNFRL